MTPREPMRRTAWARIVPVLGLQFRTLLVVLAAGFASAHVPVFPEGDGPFAVEAPTVSKAYYLRLETDSAHAFVVPPLPRTVPWQVLVVDDADGARLAHDVTFACADDDGAPTVERLDLAYFEPFSQVEHRIRLRGTLGPSHDACTVTVRQAAGPPGPYTFVIGDEERFSAADLLGLIGLGRRLETWREGPDR